MPKIIIEVSEDEMEQEPSSSHAQERPHKGLKRRSCSDPSGRSKPLPLPNIKREKLEVGDQGQNSVAGEKEVYPQEASCSEAVPSGLQTTIERQTVRPVATCTNGIVQWQLEGIVTEHSNFVTVDVAGLLALAGNQLDVGSLMTTLTELDPSTRPRLVLQLEGPNAKKSLNTYLTNTMLWSMLMKQN